jgi:pimeloyl-ACP methyl ester carboxylesterase
MIGPLLTHRRDIVMESSHPEPPAQDLPDGASAPSTSAHMSRRAFTGGVAAAAGLSLLGGWASSAAAKAPLADIAGRGDEGRGFGSVSTAPGLPRDFSRTFQSRMIQANGIRQHAVIGGDGPPLLLVHGWPENWYAWRLLMPALARDFTVIAVDQRGIGLSDKPRDGYDTATLANDLVGLMDALGHDRFAVVGHDTGYTISYALAADHRDRVARVALAEIPGPPGVDPDHEPKLFLKEPDNNRLWHIPFNRVNDELIVEMVSRSADAYYRYEFDVQGFGFTPPDDAIRYYIKVFTRSRDALRASFGLYRAWDATGAQNLARAANPLTIPVLAIGGGDSWGNLAGIGMAKAAVDVQTVVIPHTGHWVAEQAPDQVLAALTGFLAPYLAGS